MYPLYFRYKFRHILSNIFRFTRSAKLTSQTHMLTTVQTDGWNLFIYLFIFYQVKISNQKYRFLYIFLEEEKQNKTKQKKDQKVGNMYPLCFRYKFRYTFPIQVLMLACADAQFLSIVTLHLNRGQATPGPQPMRWLSGPSLLAEIG